jgi:sugar phosphate isomerase/epimerase
MMTYSRRQFGKMALVGIPMASVLMSEKDLFGADKPNSKFNGVQIGIIAPYSFRGMPGDAESLLKDIVQLGISACELQNTPAEQFAGAPVQAGRGGGQGGVPGAPGAPGGAASGAAGAAGQAGPDGAAAGGRRGGRAPLTPEQQAAQKAAADAMTKWRLSVSMDKYKALRKMYNDAGVQIYAFKLGFTNAMSDDEYSYVFNVAEALGANQITQELPTDPALTQRIGDFAAKRKMMVGYHAHTQATMTAWDVALSQSKYNGINIDCGHYTAGTSSSPIPLIKLHHDRITSIHLKDRKFGTNWPPRSPTDPDGGHNMPWGEGDTPIKEILQLMKKEKYNFPATIEFEYPVPDGSDVMTELGKCVQYAKTSLA